MENGFVGFLHGIVDDIERHAYVARMRRLDDHLLADIGLRRDQLDTIILHPQRARIRATGFERRKTAPVPLVTGCG